MHKDQNGFTAVEILITFLIIVLLGAGTWYVWKNQQDKPTSATAQSQQRTESNNKPRQEKKKVVIPDDYQQYTDSGAGFSIAYPKAWGELGPTETIDKGNSRQTAKMDVPLRGADSEATLEGSFAIAVVEKEGFQLTTKKYGADIQSTLEDGKYVWRVMAVNPADEADKVGGVYTPKVTTNATGLTLLDFTAGDEGTLGIRWILVTSDRYILISLPQRISPETFLGGPDAAGDKASYELLGKTILDTIQAF